MVMGAAIICMRLNAPSGTWLKLDASDAADAAVGDVNAAFAANPDDVGCVGNGPGWDVLMVGTPVVPAIAVPAVPRPALDEPPETTPSEPRAPGGAPLALVRM